MRYGIRAKDRTFAAMSMKIVEVNDKASTEKWMRLPWSIYKNDKNWIPHLKQDVAKVFDPSTNKLLKEGQAKRWLLLDGTGGTIGRIAAFINPKTAHTEKQPTGGMGFFECQNDQAAANMLLDAARNWLTQHGMEAMDGPINLGDRNMFWGLLIKNFSDPPIYGTNYNPSYYKDLLEGYGFQLYFNQLFFKRSALLPVQPIFHRKFQQLEADPDIRMHDARDRSVQQIAEDFCIVYNDAWVDHENHKPMELATALKIVKAMKPVMDPRLIIFIRHKDRPIAMYISLPELNEIFRYVNGDLNWLGKLKFLWYQKRGVVTTMTGIVFGVAKEFQGKGMEGALIVYAEKFIVNKKLYKDTILTWVGDFNPRMVRVCENLGAENYRTLATYRYLFDRTHPFERHPVIEKK
jgi:GNAT superfamily N-acetyltransferase